MVSAHSKRMLMTVSGSFVSTDTMLSVTVVTVAP